MSSENILSKDIKEKIDQTTATELKIVGIGASAGGLEALQELVGTLPESDNLSYVIAQHVSPTHMSMLINILAPLTTLKVQNLKDKQSPKGATVYITPPNYNVILKNGLLFLTEPQQTLGPKPSINKFLTSLAEETGEKAIGIILSGTGSDGANGLRAIKAGGGITIAQEPKSAKYDGMPKAAIQTGCVDLILHPKEIGPSLKQLVLQQQNLISYFTGDPQTDLYTKIINLVRMDTAFHLEDYKPTTIQRRITRRMNILGLNSLKEYIENLKTNRNEAHALMYDIFVRVTSFFRDIDAFSILENVISEIVKQQRKQAVIRCWIPACSTGEEAYSIAMLFEEALKKQSRTDLQYLIFASDMDEGALKYARNAIYPIEELEKIPQIMREAYTEISSKHGRIVELIRNHVIFARQNVNRDPPFARLDLISCRNFLIYLNSSVQEKLLEIFHYSLNPDGYLFLGKAESADLHKKLFTARDSQTKIYKRLNNSIKYQSPVISQIPKTYPEKNEIRRDMTMPRDIVSMRTLENLVDRFAPPSLVINETNHIVHFQGNPKPFLNFPTGRAEMSLFNLLENSMRAEMRALILRCRRDMDTVKGSALTYKIDEKPYNLTLEVSPLEKKQRQYLIVTFNALLSEECRETVSQQSTSDCTNSIISELEQELANTRRHLNIVVEELETSNEELQTLNEELQSTNEEFQSMNEELQTSNEELQSTNEELLTVNEELQIKSEELEKTATNLTNVKESFFFPLLVVNKQFHITQANKTCRDIIESDVPLENCSLNDIHWLIQLPSLFENIRNTIKTGKYHVEVCTSQKGTVYRSHIMPYRNLTGETTGVILLFTDITKQYDTEKALLASNERFDLAMRGSNDGLWDWDIRKRIIYWSPRFKEILGYKEDELENNLNIWEAKLHPEDKDPTIEALNNSIEKGKPYDVQYRLRHRSGNYLWIQARGRVLCGEDGKPSRIAGALRDITQQKLAEITLKESEQKFHHAMIYAPIGISLIATDGHYLEVNPQLCKIVGYTQEELLQLDYLSLTDERDKAESKKYVQQLIAGEIGAYKTEKRYIHKDGRRVWVETNVSLVCDNSGQPHYLVSQIQDIELRKQAEEELRLAASVFTNTQDGIMIISVDNRILKVNDAFEKILGYQSDEIIGKYTDDVLSSGYHDNFFFKNIKETVDSSGGWQGEIWNRHKNGDIIPLWLSITCLTDEQGTVTRYIEIFYNLTEQKKSQERINYLAHYDALTGLPNRTLFMDRFSHALNQAKRQKHLLALMFIDLDNFKHINDSYGHPVGDELLREVAKRLSSATRETDSIARMSGDEFTLFIEDAKDINDIRFTAEKILKLFTQAINIKKARFFITASIGISLFPDDGDEITTLVKNADLAMYRSKDAGKNQIHFYTKDLSNTAKERMLLHNDLRHSLDQRELELYFQPIIKIDNKEKIGAEALVRWNHPNRGQLPPNKFIPLAEENGLIHRLGEWVLFCACNQMILWLEDKLPIKFITVNVSGKQIAKGNFVDVAKDVLEATKCPANKIVIELTESFIMTERESSIKHLYALRDLGFGLAIDDFGTGYSSLSYLKRLPITRIKLDKSFVRDIFSDNNDKAIVRAILRLGETLGLEVVAEGVETEEQHAFLLSEGCSLGQGYLYGAPVPVPTFIDLLK